MDNSQHHALLSPPVSAASPAPTTTSFTSRNAELPTPRSHPLRSGSQKEIALINYLDEKILMITRRYAKKFSDEMNEKDDAPGYTTYDEFVSDADPLLDVVWVSGTPTIQIAYLLSLAGLACSYMPAFPFSPSLFYITAKIDRGFNSLLQASENGNNPATHAHRVSMTEKVRIKSLIEATRIMAVNVASSAGHSARISDLSELDTENEDEEDTDGTIEDHRDGTSGISTSLGLSKIYKRTLEILGDSLLDGIFPQVQDTEDLPMS
ncbi:hypothetical protein LTR41_006627 [Exophiala xenobiotica]|nr:hypothetical protein LTR41_006627 [Exophiala xenobiotica]KAK5555062.1 hypothetical protein LTR46_006692 [Exophiala xenobiotica]